MLAFSGAGTVVHVVRVRWWVGMVVRFVCVIRVPVFPRMSRVVSRLPPVSPGVLPELGLTLSHVRTRGFLLGPINDVQQ